MISSDNEKHSDDDPRYSMLLDQFEASRMSHAEAPHLHRWLSDRASERLQQKAISMAIPVESLAKQIKVCTVLEKSASTIAKQFDFLNQFSALDAALSQAFLTNLQQTKRDSESSAPQWNSFRERLAADGLLLVEIARLAKEQFKEMDAKKGRPAKVWRNARFGELVHRLLQLHSCSREECILLATSLWNIYFPNEKINDSDNGEMIIRRRKKGLLPQGQNTTKTD